MAIEQNYCLTGERVDGIGFGNLQLIQKPEEFCYGVDAVILADFVASSYVKGTVVDLGTGTGIIPVILSHLTEAKNLVGVEVQKASYERALRNASINKLEDRLTFLHEDVSNIGALKQQLGYVGMVVSNPPYIQSDGGLKNTNDAKRIARHESTASLSDFIHTAAELLEDKGSFFMVHRPSRLVDICELCRKYRLEPKEMRFVSPNRETAPNILLVHCVKHGGRELRMLDPLYIYNGDGSYTAEINKIYERKKL